MTKRDSPFSSFSCIAPRNDEKGPSLFVIKREVAIGRPDRHHAIEIAYSHRTTASGQHFVRIRRLAVGPRGSTPPPRRKRPARGDPRAGLRARAQNENAPCWPAASCSPTDYTAVPSALGGLTSGFGTGPGVPPLPWPPANKGRSHPPAPPVRALRAAQRSKASLQGRDRDRMPSPRRREGE